MLNNDFKRRWAMSLMFSDYVQGTGNLATLFNNTITYCCLGVACILADMKARFHGSGVITFYAVTDEKDYEGQPIMDEETAHLPHYMVKRYGFEENDPKICITSGHDQDLVLRAIGEKQDTLSLQNRTTTTRKDLQNISLASLNDRGVPFRVIGQLILRYM